LPTPLLPGCEPDPCGGIGAAAGAGIGVGI
jgi:hypothetical protein